MNFVELWIFQQTLCHYWPKENEALTFGEFYTETLSEVQCDGFVRHNIKITLKVYYNDVIIVIN